MAPEIALDQCRAFPRGSVVLDPMAGSGTTLRLAAEHNHKGIGFDTDPLSVLLASVWTTPVDVLELMRVGHDAISCAKKIKLAQIALPWIDDDEPTKAYIDFWFGVKQRNDLRKLCYCIAPIQGSIGDVLRLAISKIIVTKQRGASLAWDVSHGRPHKVKERNDFQVLDGYEQALKRIANLLKDQPPPGNVQIHIGDARFMHSIANNSVDVVMTSPPYLNAIDYMRGHRLALVWLGYRMGDLGAIRSANIGAERRLTDIEQIRLANELLAHIRFDGDLSTSHKGMIQRYAFDMYTVITEFHRVLRHGGKLVIVIGNSHLTGVLVDNALILSHIADRIGLQSTARHERAIPANRRYLPPPRKAERTTLDNRMLTETILAFDRP